MAMRTDCKLSTFLSLDVHSPFSASPQSNSVSSIPGSFVGVFVLLCWFCSFALLASSQRVSTFSVTGGVMLVPKSQRVSTVIPGEIGQLRTAFDQHVDRIARYCEVNLDSIEDVRWLRIASSS